MSDPDDDLDPLLWHRARSPQRRREVAQAELEATVQRMARTWVEIIAPAAERVAAGLAAIGSVRLQQHHGPADDPFRRHGRG